MDEQKEPDVKAVVSESPKKSHKIIKYVVMGIFILLPFIGFYLGMQFEKQTRHQISVQEVEKLTSDLNIANEQITYLKKKIPKTTPRPTIDPNSCSKLSKSNTLDIVDSETEGMCVVSYGKNGYKFEYPKEWTILSIGAAGTNLGFRTSEDEKLFMHLIVTTSNDSNINNAYLATSSYELSPTTTLIEDNEVIVSKNIEQYGNNTVQHVRVEKDGSEFSKYFLIREVSETEYFTVYMFELFVDDDATTHKVEKILESF